MAYAEQVFSAAQAKLHIHTAEMTEGNLTAETYLVGYVKNASIEVTKDAEAIMQIGTSMPQDIKSGNFGFTFNFEKIWVNVAVSAYLGVSTSFLGTTYNSNPTKYYIALEASEGTASGDDYLNAQLKNGVFTRWGASTATGDVEIIQGVDGLAEDVQVVSGER